MPYRRLPNTDLARMRALKAALQMGETVPPFKLAFSQAALHKLRHFYSGFEQMIMQQKTAIITQNTKSRDVINATRRARLYISHFYQVLNFAILRGEIAASSRKFYGLKENDSRLPQLTTEKDLVYWGEKLIKGEAERLSHGGNPVTNPTAALVKVRYEQFLESIRYQKVLQKSTAYATDRISSMRSEADSLILSIWNEVENTFDLLPEEVKREKSAKYGVVYVFRPYERENSNEEPEPQENDSTTLEELDVLNQLNNDRRKTIDELVTEKDEASEQLQYAFPFSDN